MPRLQISVATWITGCTVAGVFVGTVHSESGLLFWASPTFLLGPVLVGVLVAEWMNIPPYGRHVSSILLGLSFLALGGMSYFMFEFFVYAVFAVGVMWMLNVPLVVFVWAIHRS